MDLQKQLDTYKQKPLPALPPKEKKKLPEERNLEDNVFSMDTDELMERSPLDEPVEEEEEEEEHVLTESEILYQRTLLYLTQLNNGFLRELIDFTNSYGELFVLPALKSEQQILQSSFNDVTVTLVINFTELVRDHFLAQQESRYVMKLLEQLADALAKVPESDSGMDISALVASVLSDTVKSYMQHQLSNCLNGFKAKINVLQKFLPNRSESIPIDDPTSAGMNCDRLADEMIPDVRKFIESCSVSRKSFR